MPTPASHNGSTKQRNIPWPLFFLWIMSLSVNGYASPVIIDSNNEVTLLTEQLQYLEDTSGKLNIEQVSAHEYKRLFIQNADEILDFGRSRSNYWIRFDIQLNTDKDTYLLIDNSIIGDVDMYIPQFGQSKIANKHPLNLFSKQNYRTPLFRLMLPV